VAGRMFAQPNAELAQPLRLGGKAGGQQGALLRQRFRRNRFGEHPESNAVSDGGDRMGRRADERFEESGLSTNQSVFLHAVSTAILESRERSYRSVPDCRDTQVDFIRAKVMPVPELETATAVESPWLPVHQLRLSEHLRNTGGRSGVESSSQPFAPSIVSGVRRTCWHTQCSLSFVFDCRLPLTNRAAAW
jgi:hypothetical protein